jgi:hypothetical protein
VLVNTGVLPPLRFNVGYQRLELDRTTLPGTTGGQSILSGVAGLNLGLLRLGPLQPYVTAGLGAFHITQDANDAAATTSSGSATRFGIDGGAGLSLSLGRLDAFVEERVQNVYTEAGLIDTTTIRVVPVSFGIMF